MTDPQLESPKERDAVRAVVRQTLSHLSQTGALPALPGVATAALGLCRDPDADVGELVRVLQMDVGLTTRVVRVANSPLYGRRRHAQSVQEAVVTVGLRQTCDILVAVCAKQIYAATGAYAEVFWNHALAAAVAAEELALRTRIVRPGTAFLPALLHDVGRIALELADGKAFAVVQGRIEGGEGTPAAIEREWYRFDHAQAGAILAEDWGLAAEQSAAIRWHHDPEKAPRGEELARLVNAADYVAYCMGFGTCPSPPLDVGLHALGISAEDGAAVATRAREVFEDQKRLLG
jgi:HD-like signal output (HDOD) protein